MTNEYLRACLQTKETHYYMKETQQIKCRPTQMKAKAERERCLVNPHPTINPNFLLALPSFTRPLWLSPSLLIQLFIIDQQRYNTSSLLRFEMLLSWCSLSVVHVIIWVSLNEHVLTQRLPPWKRQKNPKNLKKKKKQLSCTLHAHRWQVSIPNNF